MQHCPNKLYLNIMEKDARIFFNNFIAHIKPLHVVNTVADAYQSFRSYSVKIEYKQKYNIACKVILTEHNSCRYRYNNLHSQHSKKLDLNLYRPSHIDNVLWHKQ